MTLSSSLALILAVGVLAASPGPGVFATIAQSLTNGLRTSLALVAGIVAGDLVFLLMSVYGLSWIADFLGAVFEGIRILGGLYLMGLGLSLLRTSNSISKNPIGASQKTWSASFLSGLAITLGNPKVIVFYLSLLPTLLDLNALSTVDVILVATIVSSTLATVLSGYALVTARTRSLLSRPEKLQPLRQTAGWVMLGSGAVILARSD